MGPKITVDSSTLMNKGLEVIEAHELFGVPYDHIEVVVHPQSIIHSMVEFSDGATIAQLSLPDMRLPIGYALAYPERIGTPFGRIDWAELRRLDFEPPDRATFRCLAPGLRGRPGGRHGPGVAQRRQRGGGGRLPRRTDRAGSSIPDVLEAVLSRHDGAMAADVDAVIDADGRARAAATAVIEQVGAGRDRAGALRSRTATTPVPLAAAAAASRPRRAVAGLPAAGHRGRPCCWPSASSGRGGPS